jgi:DNA-binding NarL/FixJ family response regulator
MLNFIFFIIGIATIIIALLLLIRDSKDNNVNDKFNNEIFINSLESVEELIHEMNIALNETVSEIEQKYNILEENMNDINNQLSKSKEEVSSALNPNEFNSKSTNFTDNNRFIPIPNTKSKHEKSVTPEKKLKNQKIIELNAKGLSTSQIAKALNIGIGEVQLILNLHK